MIFVGLLSSVSIVSGGLHGTTPFFLVSGGCHGGSTLFFASCFLLASVTPSTSSFNFVENFPHIRMPSTIQEFVQTGIAVLSNLDLVPALEKSREEKWDHGETQVVCRSD